MKPILIRDCVLFDGRPADVLVQEGVVVSVDPGSEPSGDAVVVDARGGTLVPGLVDTHCHPFEYGGLKRNVDLRGVGNITGMRLRLEPRVKRAPRGAWVTGMGWDQEALSDMRMPERNDIDDITPNNPVVLTRVCGHIALLNSRAIEALGIQDSVGVEYERDPEGRLTGIVKEGALTEVYRRVPRTAESSADDLLSVEFEAGRFGLTEMHAILSPEGYIEELRALAALDSAGSLGLRYRVFVPPEAVPHLREIAPDGKRMSKVAIEGVKVYTDGSLGARTAALREPYSDDPSNSGVLRYSDKDLLGALEKADSAGLRVAVHAIGDRAIEQALDALEPITGGGNPRGHRIEHASLLPPDLLGRMARHRIRATVQPLFITSDAWASKRLGERAKHLYPLRSMLKEGIVASGSSDSPVESMSPLLGMWASMSRGGLVPEESLSLSEALDMYTQYARLNGGEPPISVAEGSAADLTLLDSDIRGMHPALLRRVGVSMSMVGGSLSFASAVAEA